MGKRVLCLVLVGWVLGAVSHGQSLVEIDPATLTDGHAYLMENVGADVPDDSANSNNGNLLGSPTVVAGLNGDALQLDGIDDGVHLPDAAAINTSTHQNHTVIAVFNCADVEKSEKQCVYEEGGSTRGLTIYVHEGLVYAAAWNRADYTPQWNPGTFISAPIGSDEWHVVAAVLRDAGPAQEDDKFEMWMDGELVDIGPGGQLQGRTDDNGVGNVQAQTIFHDGIVNAGHWFEGIIDEVWIINAALTEDELTNLSIGPNPFARSGRPRNGSLLETTATVLTWTAGDFAVSHDVYFGTSAEDVEAATPDSDTYQGSLAVPRLMVSDLSPGQTYYWRVDAINDAEPNSPWKGEVWSFWVRPAVAWDPVPGDGLPNVLQNPILTWEAGLGNLFHTVFFGESFEEVDGATAGGFMQVENTFDPGPLEPEKTYYWRVDEFSGTATAKGDVWSFTTVPVIEVTDPSLKLWWNLDAGLGLTAVDRSGHGAHGAIVGDAEWTDGYQGAGLLFASDVYVEAAGYPGITGTDPRTLCAWVRTDVANANMTIMSWGENVTGQKWRMREDVTGGLRIEVNGGFHYGVTSIGDGQWHHVAVTFEDDGTPDVLDTLLYVDGQLDATLASQATDVNTAPTGAVRIGESPWHNAPYIGVIDDARVYDRVLTEAEIQEVMRGDPLLATAVEPPRNSVVDIRNVSSLVWSAGDTAVSHDVYFGTDKEAVAGADNDAPQFQGNQTGLSFSLAGLVEFGGGDYFWRIDEVEADGTVRADNVWTFTVPDYLVVDDFESYTNFSPNRVFQTWIDGLGFSPDPNFPDGNPGNGSGAIVGYDPTLGDIMELTVVNSGGQSMPIEYDNTFAPGYSEAERTFSPARDWTAEGVTTLVIHFAGQTDNTGQLYAEIDGTRVDYPGDPADIASATFTPWEIDLASLGVNLTSVTSLTVGIDGGAAGTLFVDDIRLIR